MRRAFGKMWLDTFLARKTMPRIPNQDLSGQTIVFTGGTDGMGRAAVARFAEMGADICLLGRNIEKTQSVVDRLRVDGAKGSLSIVKCDLASMQSIRQAADEIQASFPRVDYLVNCAGMNAGARRLSADGYEMNFAVNYLGPFLLTELLLDYLVDGGTKRIVQLTSATQAAAQLDFDDLQRENNWSLFRSYTQAKLCMIMHGRDVAQRLAGTGTRINCLNPGYIKSNLTRETTGVERLFMRLFGGLAAPTWVGGERIVAAVLDPKYDEVSGQYIYEDMLMDPNPIGLDDENVVRLMQVSRELAGLSET